MEIGTPPRILCVEDDANVLLVAAEALRDAGFDVVEASNADQAMDIIENPENIDVIFTDVRMPGSLDGIDLVAHVRREHPEMPFLVVSGYANQLSERLGTLAPPTRFISKPYSLETVVKTLQELALDRP